MSHADRVALVHSAEHDNLGDEAPAADTMPPDLQTWLRLSVRLVNMDQEIARQGRELAETRSLVNRITTRFATDGRPLPALEAI